MEEKLLKDVDSIDLLAALIKRGVVEKFHMDDSPNRIEGSRFVSGTELDVKFKFGYCVRSVNMVIALPEQKERIISALNESFLTQSGIQAN